MPNQIGLKGERGMKKMFEDTVGLVIQPQDKDWEVVCVTEYKKDGTWMLGMNLITSLKDVLQLAWDEGLNIIPESLMHKMNKDTQNA